MEASLSQRFVLRIGPSSIGLNGPLDHGRWPLDAAHHRFLYPTAEPRLSLSVCHGPSEVPRGPVTFYVGQVASFYREGASWIIRLGEDEGSPSADRIVTLDACGTTGTLQMDVDRSPALAANYPLEYPLEDLLFRHLFAGCGALLVHACGIAWQGRGYLFVGSSGSGKSTTARLWRATGATVLNDDRVVLEASRDGIFIHPTPWFGDYPEVDGGAVPLAALYLLRKGSEIGFEPLHPARAAAVLLAKSFPPFWDPARIDKTMETLDRVCRSVPSGWLTVPPDHRAVAWVQSQR